VVHQLLQDHILAHYLSRYPVNTDKAITAFQWPLQEKCNG